MKKSTGGIWPVMLTPFLENGDIDFNGLEALTEFYIAHGASGLFANCLSSEMFHLSPKERTSLTEAVVKFADNRVPVVSTGTFSTDLQQNIEFISRIYDSGVASVVINSNQLCNESEGEDIFQSHLEKLVETTPKIPLGIYECPLPYKRLLSDKLISWLASSDRFSYFKDTCCNSTQIRARLSLSEDSLLALYNAHTPTGVESLRDGAAGLSPIGANFYPELYSYVYDNALKEESIKFTEVKQFIEDNDPLLHSLYPFSAKWFLQQRGLPITTHTRTRLPKAQKEEMIRLQELLATMEELF